MTLLILNLDANFQASPVENASRLTVQTISPPKRKIKVPGWQRRIQRKQF